MNWADLLSVVFIAFGVSADCFAVSLGIAASGKSVSKLLVLRLAVTFGLFQACMPLIGWLAGQTIVQSIADYDHWIAFVLLLFVGGRMIVAFIKGESESKTSDISRWGILLTLAVATSIDALAIGLSFAFLKLNIWLSVAIIGTIASIITAFSFWIGRRVSGFMGRWAQLFGGLILIVIGIRVLLTHLLS